ncbi:MULTISPECIES: CaiB/BaiF CoA-transferase family protein [Mesorhizobium]|jgi:crotonobetainyl-CoA:carnitine CoA-transferase CaiB-like acyl-CoA transferase|uniref:CaiB/BaiF CoA transferase family protein n=2 Tax=Phyllobacteriaceae TaxID=69277 RepID=UPI0007A94D89|nr:MULTISPECIES: CaiB/BaiF CoA-transferase family protein [Mesorhizobium]RUU08948.1 CoA transferase [Mesorhizobium sp. M7A.T.Ca.TU.009.01.3.2]RUV13526.1 CoA transferase [Mesorhizobium sp. M7A.T.Ca.TU.009.01.3.1]RUZ92744.1 CoA transferase [Mesorhizobium sp. M7A.F.Ca.US.003.02.2.1]RVA56833.1 CoA transferase [Mesorhizobium sp. M7A.F.Ca.US.001.01.1.1]WIE92752.1 CaiB/BaiF CoA-transferase family protein [Mesorhizobium sp. WSM4875]
MLNSLKDITVVAVEQAVAAPYASSRLADAGARVIKVERPEGDFARNYDKLVRGQSAYFVWLNRGKESVCLDLRLEADRAVLDTLIASADVFIQNLKPGSIEKLGFASADLRRRYPRLITCDISGFGESGPYSHLKAYDLIVQAETGLCAITGNQQGPARVGVSVCDISAGMTAHSAILQALYHREVTGEGTSIQVSLFDAVADWMNVPVLQNDYSGYQTVRAGVKHPSLAPYGAYRCADGKEVIFSVQNDREWVNFCEKFLKQSGLTRAPGFADNMERLAHRAQLDEIIEQRFFELSCHDAMQELEAAGLAYGRLNEVVDVSKHPHIRRVQVGTPDGAVETIAPAAIFNSELPSLRPVPALGSHTEAVREEVRALLRERAASA